MARRKTAHQAASEISQETQEKPAEPQAVPTTEPGSDEPKLRSWTTRTAPPEAAYRRFTAKDQTGRSKIFFQFHLSSGQATPNAESLAVVQAHKRTSEGYDTGLRFEDDYIHGKVWKLPNNEIGRATADSIDKGLEEFAVKLEEKGRGA